MRKENNYKSGKEKLTTRFRRRKELLVRFSISTGAGLEVYTYQSDRTEHVLISPNLVSGFMTAIQLYAETIGTSLKQIQFSNLVLYLRSYGDFSLRLLLDEKMNEEEIEALFEKLAREAIEILPHTQYGIMPDEEDVEKRILPLLNSLLKEPSPLQTMTSKSREESGQKVESVPVNKSDSKIESISKIALVGLASVGKTSIKNIFFENWSKEKAQKTKPTLGFAVTHSFQDFLAHRFLIMDFGGQVEYRAQYLKQEEIWRRISALIFVVDIQDAESFEVARDYLHEVLKVVSNADKSMPRLSIFFHKYDINKREQLKENLKKAFYHFKNYVDIANFHLTTIEDSSSNIALVKALFFSLPSIMLKRLLEEELLDHFESEILPRFTTFDENTFQALKKEIHQSAVVLGMSYSRSLQQAWLKYLMGKWTPKYRSLQSKIFQVTQKGQEIYLEMEDMTANKAEKELTITLLNGMLEGILKTFDLDAPELIKDEGIFTTWKINLNVRGISDLTR